MIHFVGAGPGAADLITMRGHQLLTEADVIIYAGSLVNPELLQYAKASCSIYNSASMTLEEVIDVMKQAEAKNQMTVRLHTGDPSLYGAIREQMDQLDKDNISYDVVPGVSSFCGAAAALKAEYTLPNVSQSVIITRMAGKTPVPEKEEIALLAAHQATMVIFLSVGQIAELVQQLSTSYPLQTPVAVVYKASWPDQKLVTGTLETIAEQVQAAGIQKTALVLVGEFLGDTYALSKLYDKTFTHEYRKGVES